MIKPEQIIQVVIAHMPHLSSSVLVQQLFDTGGAQPLEDPGIPFQRLPLGVMIRIRIIRHYKVLVPYDQT
jgi:hypothetical protein